MTTTVDTSHLNEMMNQLHDALIGKGKYGDAATIIEDESRRWVKQVERFIPPKNQAQGNAAVERDFARAMTPAVAGDDAAKSPMRNKFGVIYERSAQQLISGGNTGLFNDYIKHVSQNAGIFKGWTAKPFSPELHKQVRDSRGRVTRTKRVFVLELGAWKIRLAKLKKRVGWMKAGFLPAMQFFGLNPRSFVARHSNPAGYINVNLGGTNPTITITNTAKGVGLVVGRIAQEATRARGEAIRKRIRLVLSNYSENVAKGIRISRKEKYNASS